MMRLSSDEEFERYFSSQEFKKTLQDYDAMQKSGKQVYFDADQLTDIAEYYAAQGAHDKAEAALEYALQLHPGSTDPLVFKARNFIASDDLKSAYELCRSIPDQKDFEVVLLYAEIYLAKKLPDKADKVLMEYINDQEESDPDRKCAQMRDCSDIFSDYSYYEYSLKWGYTLLDFATQGTPHQDNVIFAKETVLMALRDLQRYDEAIELSNEILDKDPYHITTWLIQCEIYIAQKMYNEAAEAADYALAIDETNANAIFSKANCFFFLNNMDKAIKLYKECIRQNFHNDLCHYMCGLAEASRMNHMQALNELIAAYKIVGDDASYSFELYYNMALNFAAIGRKNEALFFYEQAMDVEPGNPSLDGLIDYIDELPDEEPETDIPPLMQGGDCPS